jgi:hypothetical protein
MPLPIIGLLEQPMELAQIGKLAFRRKRLCPSNRISVQRNFEEGLQHEGNAVAEEQFAEQRSSHIRY